MEVPQRDWERERKRRPIKITWTRTRMKNGPANDLSICARSRAMMIVSHYFPHAHSLTHGPYRHTDRSQSNERWKLAGTAKQLFIPLISTFDKNCLARSSSERGGGGGERGAVKWKISAIRDGANKETAQLCAHFSDRRVVYSHLIRSARSRIAWPYVYWWEARCCLITAGDKIEWKMNWYVCWSNINCCALS